MTGHGDNRKFGHNMKMDEEALVRIGPKARQKDKAYVLFQIGSWIEKTLKACERLPASN